MRHPDTFTPLIEPVRDPDEVTLPKLRNPAAHTDACDLWCNLTLPEGTEVSTPNGEGVVSRHRRGSYVVYFADTRTVCHYLPSVIRTV